MKFCKNAILGATLAIINLPAHADNFTLTEKFNTGDSLVATFTADATPAGAINVSNNSIVLTFDGKVDNTQFYTNSYSLTLHSFVSGLQGAIGYNQSINDFIFSDSSTPGGYHTAYIFDATAVDGIVDVVNSSLGLNLATNFGDSVTNYSLVDDSTLPAPVPVPGAVWLFATGLVGLLGRKLRANLG